MSGICHWCDTPTDNITKVYDKGRLVWVGCKKCAQKQGR